MAAIQDVLGSLINILGADSTIAALVGAQPNDRIYGLELDVDEASNMPRKSLMLNLAGGVGRDDYADYSVNRVDVFAYGETGFEANKLHRTTAAVLKSIQRETSSSVLVHRCSLESGGVFLRDPDTDWALIISTWSVLFGDGSTA